MRIPSKFELLRFCKATGATARATFGAPSADELGFAKYLSVQVGRVGWCSRQRLWPAQGLVRPPAHTLTTALLAPAPLPTYLLPTSKPPPPSYPPTPCTPAQEIGGANCLVLRQDAALGSISTIVLRGATDGFLDDVERACNDGVNAFKVSVRACLLAVPCAIFLLFSGCICALVVEAVCVLGRLHAHKLQRWIVVLP